MQHWVYAGIHLYLHLPAIYVNPDTNSNTGTQIYTYPAGSAYPSTAPVIATLTAKLKQRGAAARSNYNSTANCHETRRKRARKFL